MQNGMNVTDAFAPMLKRIMEVALNTEVDEFMKSNKAKANRLNGKSRKTIKTSSGTFELETPRDRLSEFEPQTVKKRQTSIPKDIEDKVLAMYINGMTSYNDIRAMVLDIFKVEISSSLITQITDKILDELKEWKMRVLDDVYPIVFMDAIHFKVREDKAGYTLLGINTDGVRES